MKTPEEILNLRNKIAGTLGTQPVQDVLNEFLATARAELLSCTPSEKDPHSYNVHRALGRVEMLQYLINQGKSANKATETKEKK
jgi:hypothetical protein